MPWYDDFDALAAARFPDLEVLREEPMLSLLMSA